jgi:hypothetical protein
LLLLIQNGQMSYLSLYNFLLFLEFPRRIQLEASDYRATIRLHFPL